MKLTKSLFSIILISIFINNFAQSPKKEEKTKEVQPLLSTEEQFFSGPIQIFSDPKNKKLTKKLSPWILPNENLRYDQTCYVGAHNCNSAYDLGYKPYAQQKWGPAEQLKHGIRIIDIDIWPTEKKTNKKCDRTENESIEEYSKRATIRMCHGKCSINPLLRPANLLKNLVKLKKIKKMTLPLFSDALNDIKIFLKTNENEIVTLILENYSDNDLVDKILEETELANLILKPNDWNFEQNNNWPTIKWLIKEKKRLIIFNDNYKNIENNKIKPTKYTFPSWLFMTENKYGEIYEESKLIREEAHYWKHIKENVYKEKFLGNKLLRLNLFPQFPIPYRNKVNLIKFLKEFKNSTQYTKLNTIGIENLINYVYKNGLNKIENKKQIQTYDYIDKEKLPNFIVLDFTNKGNAIEIANTINKIQAQKLETKVTEQLQNLEIKQQQTEQDNRSIVTKVINRIKGVFLPGN